MLHSSLQSHLSTELAILRSLYSKSRYQHRTQPFLARMHAVCRLTGMVQNNLADGARLARLLSKLNIALELATQKSLQIIDMRHFLPLHAILVGVYGRLYALIKHAQPMCVPVSTSAPVTVLKSPVMSSGDDISQQTESVAPVQDTPAKPRKEKLPRKPKKTDAVDDIFDML